jgi:abequosyltransferase
MHIAGGNWFSHSLFLRKVNFVSVDLTRSEPLLSICIATRNRAHYLQETLETFAEQITYEVEVVVLDGASTDETSRLMENFAKKYPWLVSVRQEKNGGIDADYDLCVRHAIGKYCWLFSDDDWPLPSSVEKVLEACRGQHSFIFIDAEVRDVEMKSLILNRRANLTQDQVIQPEQQDLVFELTAKALSFIGSCVLNRELWLRCDFAHCSGYMFPHIGPLFDKKMPSSSLLIASPLIAIRYGNATWSSNSFKIWMINWPVLIWKLRGVSEGAKLKVTLQKPWLNTKIIFWQRAKGIYSTNEYKLLLNSFDVDSFQKLKLKAISCIPGSLAVVMAFVAILSITNARSFFMAELKLSRFYKKTILERGFNWLTKN